MQINVLRFIEGLLWYQDSKFLTENFSQEDRKRIKDNGEYFYNAIQESHNIDKNIEMQNIIKDIMKHKNYTTHPFYKYFENIYDYRNKPDILKKNIDKLGEKYTEELHAERMSKMSPIDHADLSDPKKEPYNNNTTETELYYRKANTLKRFPVNYDAEDMPNFTKKQQGELNTKIKRIRSFIETEESTKQKNAL